MEQNNKKYSPPAFVTVLQILEAELEREKKFQDRFRDEHASEFWPVHNRQCIVDFFKKVGEEAYNEIMAMPICNNIKTVKSEQFAIERLRGALERCKALGIDC